MFEDFDYKKAAKGGGKLITGIVKAVSPESGAGVDEAGGGLGEVLKAAGVDLTEEEAAKAAQPPKADPKASPPQKTTARRFDEFGIAPRPPKNDGKRWQEVTEYKTPDGQTVRLETPLETEQSDRDITAELLKQRGWKPEEVSKILAGPMVEAARVEEANAARVDETAGRTDEKTGISNAAAPAKRVPMAKAKRVTK